MPAATLEELGKWFDEGVAQGATHLIIMCDGFDFDDYPVFIMPGRSVREEVSLREKNSAESMQRVMEVYDLRMDKAAQLGEERAFHLEEP